jgi:predicted TIM-barrel fold metal-dependent hydrolase
MPTGYHCISGDSHIEIPPARWTDRVPAKYRSMAPKTVPLPDGADGTIIGNNPPVQNPEDLYGGKGRDKWVPFGQRYDDTPGTGSPDQRVKEQDIDGLDAEVLFPPEFCGPWLWESIEDPSAQRAVFRAFNDWLAEDYCSVAPHRLFGLGVLPFTGVADSITEMEHCTKAGLKGVVLSAFPNGTNSPAPEDDKFWEAALSMRVPLSIHVRLSRSSKNTGPPVRYPKEPPALLARTDLFDQLARFTRAGGSHTVQLILSGVLDRYPELRIDMAENQIGWVPLFLEMADLRYNRHKHWAKDLLGFAPLKQLPSEYIRQHFYWGFQQDRVGVELREHIGVDRLIWAADFPHQESEWPHSQDVITHNFAGVPDDEKNMMICDNAVRFFHLE